MHPDSGISLTDRDLRRGGVVGHLVRCQVTLNMQSLTYELHSSGPFLGNDSILIRFTQDGLLTLLLSSDACVALYVPLGGMPAVMFAVFC